MLSLIIATPSPWARKVRVALLEKGVPFETVVDVPWNDDTVVRAHNPLEKLPILITDEDGPIYDSRLILEYLELTYPQTPMLPADRAGHLLAKRLEVMHDGVCDALLLIFFERMRAAHMRSEEWTARQRRKVDRGLAEMARLVGEREFVVGERFSLGDIAVGCALGYLTVRFPEMDWRGSHPNLVPYFERLSQRPSFAETVPVPQTIIAKVA